MNGIENQPIVKVNQATNRMNNFLNVKKFHDVKIGLEDKTKLKFFNLIFVANSTAIIHHN